MSSGLNEFGMNVSLNLSCPKCNSKEVVIKIHEKYYKVCRCNSCGFTDEN